MKNISSILKANSVNREIKAIQTVEQFKEFAHKTLSENASYSFDVAEQLCESLLNENRNDIEKTIASFKTFNESVVSKSEMINEDRRDPLELTQTSFMLAFDIMSVFDSLYDLWLEYNEKTWYSNHIAHTIDQVKCYTDQYASSVSYTHSSYKAAKLNIANAEELLARKQFAGIVKRSTEWKQLNDFMRNNDVEVLVSDENSTSQAIVRAAFKEIEKFITIVSSK